MSDLPEALDAALRARYYPGGIRTPVTQARGLQARMNQLEKQHQGGRKGSAGILAAKAAGISPRTWQRWRAGTQKPGAASLRKIQAAYEKLIMRPKARRILKGKGKGQGIPNRIDVKADVRWNGYLNQVPRRTVRLGPHRIQEAMAGVIRAWGAEGPEAAAEAFERGMAWANDVPDGPDGDPGIRFEGNEVEITFHD